MERKRVQKVFLKPSKTRQEFKQECDLELTVKRFAKTPAGRDALMNAGGFVQGLRFEDVSQVPDYRQARDMIMSAEERFMQLPAIVRKRFDNDAAMFLDFALNPANLDEMRTMGLANPKVDSPVESTGV